MSTQPNPYAPPAARVEDVQGNDTQVEAIRREHLKHEASVRSVGSLYMLSSLLVVLAGVSMLAVMVPATSAAYRAGVMSAYLLLAVLFFATGFSLRKLKPWTRMTAALFSALGLLAIPIGTIINGYILYLLLSAKGKRIFAPDYAGIVAATPHIKYRTSLLVWILLGFMLLAMVAAIVIPAVRR